TRRAELERLSAADAIVGRRRFSYLLESILADLHASHPVSGEDVQLALRWHGPDVTRSTAAWHYIWRHASSVGSATGRIMSLAMVAAESVPSGPLPDYYRMLQRCYSSGYFAECEMICRSVVESALRQAFRR